MGMKHTLEVINRMEADGIIGRYAIARAVAAYNYVEPTVTEDLDILVSFDQPSGARSGLVTLRPILSLAQVGRPRRVRNEGLMIAGWAVQFLPVADDLDAEALSGADEIDLRITDLVIKTRVVRPEHLLATALRVGVQRI
jgi:hypothetical protein